MCFFPFLILPFRMLNGILLLRESYPPNPKNPFTYPLVVWVGFGIPTEQHQTSSNNRNRFFQVTKEERMFLSRLRKAIQKVARIPTIWPSWLVFSANLVSPNSQALPNTFHRFLLLKTVCSMPYV